MLSRLSKYGELHSLLKRGIVYSQRDLGDGQFSHSYKGSQASFFPSLSQ
jgi:hypothetical protein